MRVNEEKLRRIRIAETRVRMAEKKLFEAELELLEAKDDICEVEYLLKETKLIPAGMFGVEVKEKEDSDWILVNTAGEIAAGSGGKPAAFRQRRGAERSSAFYNAEDKVIAGEWFDVRVVEGEDTGK